MVGFLEIQESVLHPTRNSRFCCRAAKKNRVVPRLALLILHFTKAMLGIPVTPATIDADMLCLRSAIQWCWRSFSQRQTSCQDQCDAILEFNGESWGSPDICHIYTLHKHPFRGEQEPPDPIQVLPCWWRCTGEKSDPSCSHSLFHWWSYPGTALDAATERRLSQLKDELQSCGEPLSSLSTLILNKDMSPCITTFEGPSYDVIVIYNLACSDTSRILTMFHFISFASQRFNSWSL